MYVGTDRRRCYDHTNIIFLSSYEKPSQNQEEKTRSEISEHSKKGVRHTAHDYSPTVLGCDLILLTTYNL